MILRGRKLSFKQLANGTVVIGGGHLGGALSRRQPHVIDWRKLATSARTVWELFPAMRAATIVRAWAGIEARMPDDIPVIGPSAHRRRASSTSSASRPTASSSAPASAP